MTDTFTIPDEVEATVGWRCWRVRYEPDRLRLVSMQSEHEWTPREEQRCECRYKHDLRSTLLYSPYNIWGTTYGATPEDKYGKHEGEFAADCTCGYYAVRDIGHVHRDKSNTIDDHLAKPSPVVVGTVKLWGSVVDGERGHRAERAYPDHLYLLDHPDWHREPLWHREGRARLIADTYQTACVLLGVDEYRLMVAACPTPKQQLQSIYMPPSGPSWLRP